MWTTETLGYKKRRSNFQQQGTNFRVEPSDKIVQVLEVVPSKNRSNDGYLKVKDLTNQRIYQVIVNKDVFEREVEKGSLDKPSQLGYKGWLIDSDFEKFAKTNKYFILTNVKFFKKKEVIDGEEIYFITTDWVRNVKNYNAKKVFKGVFTVSTFRPLVDNYVQNVQEWFDVVTYKPENMEKLSEIHKNFDEIADKLKEAKELKKKAEDSNEKPMISYPVRLGFYLRALKVESKVNQQGEEYQSYTLIDSAEPFIQVPPMVKIDENGEEKHIPARPIDGEFFNEAANNYSNYVFERFSNEEFDVDGGVMPSDVVVEILLFRNYFANSSEPMQINGFKTDRMFVPLREMCAKLTKPSMDAEPEDYYEGMNLAVKGVIELSDDKVDMNTHTFIEVNTARRLNCSGWKRNVNYLVYTESGNRVSIPDEMLTEKELEARRSYQNDSGISQSGQTEISGFEDEDIL